MPFAPSKNPTPPLAEALRPSSLDGVVGQSHLLGPDKPLRLAFESGRLHSFILWGPPGVGKTTIGKLAAMSSDSEFSMISAAVAGVKEIRKAVEDAQAALQQHGQLIFGYVKEAPAGNRPQRIVFNTVNQLRF